MAELDINGMKVDFEHYMASPKAGELLKKLMQMGLRDEVDRCFAESGLKGPVYRQWLVMTKRSTKQTMEEKSIGNMKYAHVTDYGELIGVDETGMMVAVYTPADGIELWPHDEKSEEPRFTPRLMEAFYDRMLSRSWDDGQTANKKELKLNLMSSDAYTVKIRGMLLKRDLMKSGLKYLADAITVRYDGQEMLLFESTTKLGTSYVFMRHYAF